MQRIPSKRLTPGLPATGLSADRQGDVKMKLSGICQGGWRRESVLRRFMLSLLCAGALTLASAVPAAAAEASSGDPVEWFGGAPADRWVYGAEVYLWGADIGGETTSRAPVDVDFNDLFDDLELGFMGTLAAARGKWTLFGDFIYLDVEDDSKGSVTILGSPVSTEVDVELKGFITTLGGAYRFLQTDTTRLNLVAGARYLWLKADLDVDIGRLGVGGSESDTVWDGIVGLRGKTDLSDKWYLTYYADVGGGNSKTTWQALGAINYRFQRVDAVVGYRYLDWDFDDGDMLNFDDLNLSGPFAGVKFLF